MYIILLINLLYEKKEDNYSEVIVIVEENLNANHTWTDD